MQLRTMMPLADGGEQIECQGQFKIMCLLTMLTIAPARSKYLGSEAKTNQSELLGCVANSESVRQLPGARAYRVVTLVVLSLEAEEGDSQGGGAPREQGYPKGPKQATAAQLPREMSSQ
jgi:hypothetical protein